MRSSQITAHLLSTKCMDWSYLLIFLSSIHDNTHYSPQYPTSKWMCNCFTVTCLQCRSIAYFRKHKTGKCKCVLLVWMNLTLNVPASCCILFDTDSSNMQIKCIFQQVWEGFFQIKKKVFLFNLYSLFAALYPKTQALAKATKGFLSHRYKQKL